MITKNDALIIDDMTDEYAIALGNEIEKMTLHLRQIGKRILAVYWILFAITLVVACVSFIKAKKTALLQSGNYMTTMVIVFAFIGMFFYVLRGFLHNLILRISDNYNLKNGNITKRLEEFFIIRAIYEDVMEGKMSIMGFEENRLKVRCVVKGRLQTISIPVKYELLSSDKNVIRFYDNHVEFELKKNTMSVMA